MSITEDTCRWAYMKAMRNDSIRLALYNCGRAVFIDSSLISEFLPAGNRFVLSLVKMSHGGNGTRTLVYCNGVCVG